MLYMWQEEKGKLFYRFQTDDKEIADKIRNSKKFKLTGQGLNAKLWIYQIRCERISMAKNLFKNLSGSDLKFNSTEEVYYSENL